MSASGPLTRLGNAASKLLNLLCPPYVAPAAIYIRTLWSRPSARNTRAVSSGVRGHKPCFRFISESMTFSFHQGYSYLNIFTTVDDNFTFFFGWEGKGEGKGQSNSRVFLLWEEEKKRNKRGFYYLILVSCFTSSSLQPCAQPEKANMSISYLRWSARKRPFCLRMRTIFPLNSSILGVNLREIKFTLQRSF